MGCPLSVLHSCTEEATQINNDAFCLVRKTTHSVYRLKKHQKPGHLSCIKHSSKSFLKEGFVKKKKKIENGICLC